MRHAETTNDATCAHRFSRLKRNALTVWSAPSAATLARSIESIQIPGQLDIWIVFA